MQETRTRRTMGGAGPHPPSLNDPTLQIPSFTQSRTYTYESEDNNDLPNSMTGGGECGGAETFDDHSTSAASESGMASSTQSTGGNSNISGSVSGSVNMSSPGGYSSKSARFKSAMTTRARQRRMRRMKEGGGGTGGASPGATDTNNNSPGAIMGIPPLASPTTSSPSEHRVANAKEHVEQMKSYRIGGGGGGRPMIGAAPITPGTPNGGVMGEGGRNTNNNSGNNHSTTNSPLHSRLYKQHRSRSLSRSRESRSSPGGNSTNATTAVGGSNHHGGGGGDRGSRGNNDGGMGQHHHHHHPRSPSSPDLRMARYNSQGSNGSSGSGGSGVDGGASPNQHSAASARNKQSSHRFDPSAGNSHGRLASSEPHQYQHQYQQSHHYQTNNNNNNNTTAHPSSSAALPRPHVNHNHDGIMAGIPSTVTKQPHATTSTSRRKQKSLQRQASEPKPEEFLPDWKMSGGLSPEEVQDAKNFTSIQFHCSNLSGEVEMFSGDEMMLSFQEEEDDGGGGGDSSARSGSCRNGTTAANNNANNNASRKSSTSSSRRKSSSGRSSRRRNAKSPPPAEYNASPDNNNGGPTTEAAANNKQCWQNEVWSDATTPSILHRGEIFHQKAAASIVSLLSPHRMFEAGLMAPEINADEEDDAAKDVDGDSPTGVACAAADDGGLLAGGVRKKSSNLTFDGDADPGSSRGGEWRGMTQVNRTLFRNDLIDEDVKQSMIFRAFRQNMMEASPQLEELLSQIHRRGGVEMDRAFATRRKNACGALKILSAKEENRMKICWTVGVLPAIASVLSDVNVDIRDELSCDANTEARSRVVSTLLNLSVNKKNRMLIVNTPGVLESMAQTILHDTGEGRQGCCTALLYLAKTSEARMMIVKSGGMLDTLATVIEVPKPAPPKSPTRSKIKTRMMANCPVSPLSPGESTLNDTIDTARRSYRSRRSNRSEHTDSDDSDSDSDGSSHSGSRSSKSGGSHTEDDHTHGDDEHGDEKSVDSAISAVKVEQMEISFENSAAGNDATTMSEVLTSPGASQAGAAGPDAEKKEKEDIYDSDPNRFLHGARLSVFACLLCLVKSQENAFIIARDAIIVEALIGVSKRHSSPSHSRAMAIIAHLTRHPKNCHHFVFKYASLLPMLQEATASPDKEARRYAFCALQNLSMDMSCRAPIAHSPKIIWSLTQRCKAKSTGAGDNDGNEDEARMAAVATLQNLADEPANLIQFTIVKDCIGTIIQIAREDVVRCEKTDLTSFMAKNTLVTLSHWFRKIATSGSERIRDGGGGMAAGLPGGPSPGNISGGGGMPPGGTRAHFRLYSARLEPTIYNQWS